MLAPLKDRRILERDDDDAEATALRAENQMLRQALKQARRMQKRSATQAAAKIAGLEQVNRDLADAENRLHVQLAAYESGQAVIALGQQLMEMRSRNDELSAGLRQVWALDRNLCAAHRECERLARERDAALGGLQPAADQPPR